MRIGIDAMGGDYAPAAVVEGVILSSDWRSEGDVVVLYGVASDIQRLWASYTTKSMDSLHVEVEDCPEVVGMHDHPMRAISKKPNSSIVRAFKALAEGKIHGFASAGNTGAMMAGVMTYLGEVEGLLRPSIAVPIPVEGGTNVLLDVGLNADCKPEVLLQYGVLGALYSQLILKVKEPRVALLNIGVEQEKGNLLTRRAYELMKETTQYNFVGNIEGSDLFSNDRADVVVCDGFVGNVVLKQAEALYRLTLARGLGEDPYFSRFNFENYGGTPVLGISAPVVIGHGISNAKAINMMIHQTRDVISSRLCDQIKSSFQHE